MNQLHKIFLFKNKKTIAILIVCSIMFAFIFSWTFVNITTSKKDIQTDVVDNKALAIGSIINKTKKPLDMNWIKSLPYVENIYNIDKFDLFSIASSVHKGNSTGERNDIAFIIYPFNDIFKQLAGVPTPKDDTLYIANGMVPSLEGLSIDSNDLSKTAPKNTLSLELYQGSGNYIFKGAVAFMTEKSYNAYLKNIEVGYGGILHYIAQLSSPNYHLVFEEELIKKYNSDEMSYRFEGRNFTNFTQKAGDIINILKYALVIIILVSFLICYLTSKKYYNQVQSDMVNLYLNGVSRRKIKRFLYSNMAYISVLNSIIAMIIYIALLIIDETGWYNYWFIISYISIVIINYMLFTLITAFIFKKSFSMTHIMNYLRK